jgi:Cytochrome c oxidase subunit IIa family
MSRPPETEEKFFPSGAIFFFVALTVFYAVLWLVIYWLMIARS